MRLAVTSVTAFAVATFVLATAAGAEPCAWKKNQVSASVSAPAPAEAATTSTAADPWLLAQLEKAAILPVAPKEEELPQVQ